MKYYFILLITLLTIPLSADNFSFSIEKIDHTNGLPTNNIRRIHKDKEGFMWYASNSGLIRYDGIDFTHFKNSIKDPSLLPSNTILSITDDKDNVWIGTDMGLTRWNKKTKRFYKVDLFEFNKARINKITSTADGVIWLATDKGALKYVHSNGEIISFRPKGDDINSIPSYSVQDVLKDSNGILWFAFWDGGICSYDEQKDEFTRYPEINEKNSAICLFEDKDKQLWVGSWGYGLYRVDKSRKGFVEYDNLDSYDNGNKDREEYIYAINQDPIENNIWVGHRNGLSIINKKEKTIKRVEDDEFKSLNAIYTDADNTMWLGLFDGGGVRKINLNGTPLVHNPLRNLAKSIGHSSITSSWYDGKKHLWLGVKNYGLVIYNIKDDSFIDLTKKYPQINDAFVLDINFMESQNELWVSMRNKGVMRVKLSEDGLPLWVNTIARKYYITNKVRKTYQDKNDNFWLMGDPGIVIVTKDRKILKHTTLDESSDQPFTSSCFSEDREGNMWLGTSNSGVYKITLIDDKLQVTSYNLQNERLNNNQISSIFVDSQRRIWVATQGGGLNLFNSDTNSFECVNLDYKIPYDLIFNIFEDEKGNMWVHNEHVIIQFNTSEPNYSLFSSRDKLWDNVFTQSCPVVKLSPSEFLIAGTKGYCVLNTSKNINKTVYPKVQITDVEVQYKSIYQTESGVKVNRSQALELSHDQNNMRFRFISPSFTNQEKLRYAYRLSGYDSKWIYADENQLSANYTNIPYGRYIFEVTTYDQLGKINQNVTKLPLRIHPSPFESWYAWVVYFLLIVLSIYQIYRYMHHKMQVKNKIQMAEMLKANAEELAQVKLRFFTNVSHELLTPLAILDCVIDDVSNKKTIDGEQTDIMKRNISYLTRLIRQILEFRKAETDNLKLKIASGNISELLQGICEKNFKPLVEKQDLSLNIDLPEKPIYGWFDKDKLEKIFFNLMSNAFKYNKKDGFVNVKFRQEIDSKDNLAYLYLCVEDGGIGIAKDQQENIFKRFYDGDYRRQNVEGTGIGLSLVKDLVNLHKGNITFESEIDKGTKFELRIPIEISCFATADIEIVAENTDYPTISPIENTEQEALSEKTLLIVDDNSDLLRVMSHFFKDHFNVMTAYNGVEAFKIIENNAIDMLISDVMMPEMNGYELCHKVKTDIATSHIPVVLLTAKNDDSSIEQAYNIGADSFVSKPFNTSLLLAKVQSVFHNREAQSKRFKTHSGLDIEPIACSNLDDAWLEGAIKFVESNINNNDLDSDEFANNMCMSKSTLYRKIKGVTGLTPSEFVRNIRLKTACDLMSRGVTNISDVAYGVGFTDPKYFSKCFKKEFGMPPGDYIKLKLK